MLVYLVSRTMAAARWFRSPHFGIIQHLQVRNTLRYVTVLKWLHFLSITNTTWMKPFGVNTFLQNAATSTALLSFKTVLAAMSYLRATSPLSYQICGTLMNRSVWGNVMRVTSAMVKQRLINYDTKHLMNAALQICGIQRIVHVHVLKTFGIATLTHLQL